MLLVEQLAVEFPRLFRFVDRPLEPIRPLQWERSTRVSGEATACRVLPVRSVHDRLPDIVTPGIRTPSRLIDRHPPDGPPEIRSMPGRTVIRLVDDDEQL